jgi:hypothetical protein
MACLDENLPASDQFYKFLEEFYKLATVALLFGRQTSYPRA